MTTHIGCTTGVMEKPQDQKLSSVFQNMVHSDCVKLRRPQQELVALNVVSMARTKFEAIGHHAANMIMCMLYSMQQCT